MNLTNYLEPGQNSSGLHNLSGTPRKILCVKGSARQTGRCGYMLRDLCQRPQILYPPVADTAFPGSAAGSEPSSLATTALYTARLWTPFRPAVGCQQCPSDPR